MILKFFAVVKLYYNEELINRSPLVYTHVIYGLIDD